MTWPSSTARSTPTRSGSCTASRVAWRRCTASRPPALCLRRGTEMTDTLASSSSSRPTDLALIDADVHVEVPKADVLFPCLAEHWIEHIRQTRFKGPTDTAYPPKAPSTGPAITDLAALRAGLLDAAGPELGILNCAYAI